MCLRWPGKLVESARLALKRLARIKRFARICKSIRAKQAIQAAHNSNPLFLGVKFPGPFLAGNLLHQLRLTAENRPQIQNSIDERLLTAYFLQFSHLFCLGISLPFLQIGTQHRGFSAELGNLPLWTKRCIINSKTFSTCSQHVNFTFANSQDLMHVSIA